MKLPLRVVLRHMDPSPALEEEIRARVSRLDETYSLMRCSVVVESPHHHAQKGRLFSAHVSVSVPGASFVVTHEPDEDPYMAVRRSFDAARRRLAGNLARRRGKRALRRAPVHRDL